VFYVGLLTVFHVTEYLVLLPPEDMINYNHCMKFARISFNRKDSVADRIAIQQNCSNIFRVFVIQQFGNKNGFGNIIPANGVIEFNSILLYVL
jgi:hypothetical protein